MPLQNVLRTGQRKEYETSREEVWTLLAAVRRNLTDAEVTAISLETRFDAAYKAIMQLSMAALLTNGFRPSSGAGHHRTMIQAQPESSGLFKKRMMVLDALCRKRNVSNYMGGHVGQAGADACIAEAQTLLKDVEIRLAEHRTEFL